ncbi:phage tail protein [Desulfoluna butyratoxydans]|uniref:Phage tail fibre protein n=1 Tax=Desulfoluna butyratoxydans TaxID=231438 RepID=A0A4U8YRJ4_9BACT|nr:phage tail protein [Desulfoluna butyratoxydans]VFQ46926.1 phage tail fibre protein [Desulfoluna butyratoxydans]
MAESYFTTLTNTGKAMFANSPVLGQSVSFSTLAVGDGNGSYAGLELAAMLQRTTLINEVWRGSINHISVDETNSNWLVVEAFIPSDVGDFDIREVGVLDSEGNLIAIGKYPLTYKPKITQGASKDLYVKMILEVTDTAAVELKVDPAVVLATRQHVADELQASVEAERLHLAEELRAYSVGMVGFFDREVPPAGWMEANGSECPEKATVLNTILAGRHGMGPSGRSLLPDLRGEFVRGWDNGRGVDADRVLGSWQGDAIRNITGEWETTIDAESLSFAGSARFTGALYRSKPNIAKQFTTVSGANSSIDGVGFDASRVVPTASENRSRNGAFLACIYAGI